MSSYPIFSWQPVLANNNYNKFAPMIYIKPDKNFIEYIDKNFNVVKCKISNTNTSYDDKELLGVVHKSANYPSYRPNFYDKHGYYVITLISNWYGYPKKGEYGNMTLITDVESLKENTDVKNNYIKDDKTTDESSLQLSLDQSSNTGIYTNIIIVGSIILFFILVFFARKIFNKKEEK